MECLKDYLEYQGFTGITCSRDATREAFNKSIIDDSEGWMEMIKSRNFSTHTYNENLVSELLIKIIDIYYPILIGFKVKFNSLI